MVLVRQDFTNSQFLRREKNILKNQLLKNY